MRTFASRLATAIVPVILASAGLAALDEPAAENVRFRWGLGAMAGPAGKRAFTPVKGDLPLQSGDELKLFVSPLTKCYVYVLFHGSRNDLTLLFPGSPKQFDTSYAVNGAYYVPPKEQWMRLDEHPGREAIYVLASAQRLGALEELISKHSAAADRVKDAITQEILAEIRDLRRRHRNLQAAAERPSLVAGAVRSVGRPDVATVATEVSARDFYAKTITIDHR